MVVPPVSPLAGSMRGFPAPRLPHAPCLPPRLRRPLCPILIVPLILASLMTQHVCMIPLCSALYLCPRPFPVPYLPRPV